MRNSGGADRGAPPGVALDEMTEDDLDDVLRIEKASFATPWTRAQFLADLHRPIARNPVLRRGGRVVAYACAAIAADEAEIHNVAVDPPERRSGLASYLLLSLLGEAARRGCRSAHLEVRESNEAAIKLYRTLGFLPTGRRRGYYADPREDAVLMTARLVRRTAKAEPEDP